MKHLLFICTLNQIRSRTAEEVYKKDPRFEVRSAGTASNARVPVSASLLSWADIIFVMEREHQNILNAKFPEEIKTKQIVNLDIPDSYQYMDEELIEMLQAQVTVSL